MYWGQISNCTHCATAFLHTKLQATGKSIPLHLAREMWRLELQVSRLGKVRVLVIRTYDADFPRNQYLPAATRTRSAPLPLALRDAGHACRAHLAMRQCAPSRVSEKPTAAVVGHSVGRKPSVLPRNRPALQMTPDARVSYCFLLVTVSPTWSPWCCSSSSRSRRRRLEAQVSTLESIRPVSLARWLRLLPFVVT